MSMTDQELLQAFIRQRDDAFAQLVERHLPLVYHTAARIVGKGSADDVTQAVFALLASKASELVDHPSLAGWLHHATRFCSQNYRKMEERRHRHEREAAMQKDPVSADTSIISDESREHLRALLDDALARLKPPEREAVLLRYLENRSIEETASALAIAPAAAAKRAERGLNRLREILGAKGFALPAAALSAALGAESSQAIPAALLSAGIAAPASATAIAAATKLGSGVTTSTYIKTSIILLAKLAIVTGLAIAVGVGAIGLFSSWKPRPAATLPPRPAAAPVALAPEPVEEHLLDADPKDELHLACYGLLADGGLIAQLRALTPPLATGSSGFTLYRMPAARLHQVLRLAHQANPLVITSSNILFGSEQRRPGDLLPSFAVNSERVRAAGLPDLHVTGGWRRSVQGQDPVLETTGSNQLAVNLNHRLQGCEITLMDGRLARYPLYGELNARLSFDADQAVVAVSNTVQTESADLAVVMIVESFRFNEALAKYLDALTSTEIYHWPLYGAAYARWTAARAAVWEAQAPRAIVHNRSSSPAWDVQVDDITTVRLLALGRPRVGTACWWDPEGNAVAGVQPHFFMYDPDDRVCAVVETSGTFVGGMVRGSVSQGIPTGHYRFTPNTRMWNDREGWSVSVAPTDALGGRITVGVGIGPGHLLGEIHRGLRQEQIGHVTLSSLYWQGEDMPFNFMALCKGHRPDEDLHVVLTLNDGTVTPVLGPPQAIFISNQQTRNIQVRASTKLRDVRKVELWSRPLKMVTFAPAAMAPKIEPRQSFSLDELLAAEKAVSGKNQVTEERMPVYTKPDATTPAGAIALMRQLAQANNLPAVRAMIVTADARESAAADIVARLIVETESIRADAEKRFSPLNVQAAFRHSLLAGINSLQSVQWIVAGDSAVTQGDEFFCLTRRDDKWLLDFRSREHGGRNSEQILQASEQVAAFLPAIAAVHQEMNEGKYASARDVANGIGPKMSALKNSGPPGLK